MSDDSQLYFLDGPARPLQGESDDNGSPYLLAEWHLPIVWLALFNARDIRLDPTSRHDKENPYFAVETQFAISNLEKRKQWIHTAIPDLEPVWLSRFSQFLAETELRWVHMDPVRPFDEEGQRADEWLASLLMVFDRPPSCVLGKPFDQAHAEDRYHQHFGTAYRHSGLALRISCFGGSGMMEAAPWETDGA